MMCDKVVIRVPASTSNCGPGFDTLGLALSLYGTVTVTRTNNDQIDYNGDSKNFPKEAIAAVQQVAQAFFKQTGTEPNGFGFNIDSEVPIARGLGSSVILRGGFLAGINHLCGSPLSIEEQVELISRIEGHPDNASATILGGFTVARFCPDSNRYLGTQKFEVSDSLVFVVVSPELEIKTDDSRGSLPSQIEFSKVVSSLNSLAFLVAAFASANYEYLSACRIDHIHQPYRLPKIPKSKEAIESGITAGALTGWLSGSGSSVLCVARKADSEKVLAAMELEFKQSSIDFHSYELLADNDGITVIG
ncbi:MAG: homoserine kinase [Verrucomicrobia bacterium]|nr:homoserine kinase [Verrucomicrobiota bacterium]MDA1066639.1 homoserine kinase [Verrucomicrobiota bacterium]